jgi:hypothetical protein
MALGGRLDGAAALAIEAGVLSPDAVRSTGEEKVLGQWWWSWQLAIAANGDRFGGGLDDWWRFGGGVAKAKPSVAAGAVYL